MRQFDLENIHSVRQSVVKAVKLVTHGSVLDIGSSVGRHSLYCAKRGFKVTALDNRSEIVAALKEISRLSHLQIKVVKTDAESFKPRNRFDLILCNMLLHFLDFKSTQKVVTMMINSTKSGGVNVVSNYTTKNKRDPFRPGLIEPGKLVKMYTSCGWKILDYYEGKGYGIKQGTSPYFIEEFIVQKPLRIK